MISYNMKQVVSGSHIYHGEVIKNTPLYVSSPMMTNSHWAGVCCYRGLVSFRGWPWTSAGRSGSNWTLPRDTCIRMWCWRSTATFSPWVSTPELGLLDGPPWDVPPSCGMSGTSEECKSSLSWASQIVHSSWSSLNVTLFLMKMCQWEKASLNNPWSPMPMHAKSL